LNARDDLAMEGWYGFLDIETRLYTTGRSRSGLLLAIRLAHAQVVNNYSRNELKFQLNRLASDIEIGRFVDFEGCWVYRSVVPIRVRTPTWRPIKKARLRPDENGEPIL